MGKLDGVIVLSADGRPIVHSHFANSIATYPLLHTDYLNTLLSSIAAANAQLSSSSKDAADTGKVYFSKDIKPVLWVPGIPDLPVDNDQDEDERDESSDDEDDEVGRLGTSLQDKVILADDDGGLEEANVWSDAAGLEKPSSPEPAPTISQLQDQADRGAEIVAQAHEALAERGAALCHIQSGNLRFLCPVAKEVDPLVPLSFLRAFITILQEYLAQSADPAALTEDVIRDNFDIVYQLFEEILDKDGNVLTTEVNTLKSLVMPPSWVDKIVKAVGVGGLSSAAPPPMVSAIPWRRPNTKYTNNELYVDLVESLEGIVSRSGKAVSLDLFGTLECNAKLSGTPDLTLTLSNPGLVDDASFHPCVRHRRWRRDKVLSFIPPDGAFELASFHLSNSDRPLPLAIEASFEPNQGTFSVSVVPRRMLENVSVSFGLGAGTQSVDASVSNGTYIWEQRDKVISWNLASIDPNDRPPVIKGTWSSTEVPPRPSSAVSVSFSAPGHTLSGLKVSSLLVHGENYRPFKGVRSILTGRLDWRV